MKLRTATTCLFLLLAVPGCAAQLVSSSPPETAMPAAAGTAAPTSAKGVLSQVELELWHCGIRPVAFDGMTWRAESTLDGTNAPPGFGTGTMERTATDAATFTDGASGEIVTFAPLVGEYDPPPCA